MRCSVVVVTYNHREDIQRCLSALLPTLGAADEVIVVDNASSDGTADVVAEAYPTVRLVRSAANPGFGAACNQAARLSEAAYLVFLNPDTEPQPGWLDALIVGLESTPRAGLATAKLVLAHAPHLIDAFGHDVHISGIATCRGWGQPVARFSETEEVPAVSGACFAIRRELFEHLGGFDARMFMYYEDDDLSLRARLSGFTCIAVPNARVLHDHAPGFSPAKLRYLERNRWWTMLTVYRPRTLLGLLPVLVTAEALTWGMAIRFGPRHVAAKFGAWVDLLRWLPEVGLKRRQTPRGTADSDLLRLHGVAMRTDQLAGGGLVRWVAALATPAFQVARALCWLVATK